MAKEKKGIESYMTNRRGSSDVKLTTHLVQFGQGKLPELLKGISNGISRHQLANLCKERYSAATTIPFLNSRKKKSFSCIFCLHFDYYICCKQ